MPLLKGQRKKHLEKEDQHYFLPVKPKPAIGPPTSPEVLGSKKPLPSDDVLIALFNKLLERLNLPPEKIAEMNMMTREQKWSLVLAQHEMSTGVSSLYYIEQLVRHAQPTLKEKKLKRRELQNLHPLAEVLKELEIDLRTNPQQSWVTEFVSTPNHGHIALIDLVSDLLENPYPVARKNPQKYAVLARSPQNLYVALSCIKTLMGHRRGFAAVLSYEPSVFVLAHCLTATSRKARILVLKLLVTVMLVPNGLAKVMQAFDQFRIVANEQKKFQWIVLSLTDEPIDHTYQAEVMRFINTVVQTALEPNAKVFHQQEFIDAGLSVQEIRETLRGQLDEGLMHELRQWERNYINVQGLMDDLFLARARTTGLREEVEEKITMLRETMVERDNLYDQANYFMEKNDKQKGKIAALREEISQLMDLKMERDDLKAQVEQLLDANRHYHQHTEELTQKISEMTEGNILGSKGLVGVTETATQTELVADLEGILLRVADNEGETGEGKEKPFIPDPPPPPPLPGEPPSISAMSPLPGQVPIPPPLPGEGQTIKKPYITNVPLPMLNWMPIRNAEHTIFQEMNDEEIVDSVDFSEFEALFQVKRFKKQRKKKNTANKAAHSQVELFDTKRSRGIVFAKRRVKQSPELVMQHINNTDLDGLPGEHCELLLQIIPQENEKAEMAKKADSFADFGEAEQFLYQLAKIARLEQRLSAMSYMGSFDETLLLTQPRVDAVLNASLSIFRSARLKKVLEIILAFGNYMNSSRRGAVTGFKLESLEKLMDTRTNDRKQTLLHYITHVVENMYPNVLSFHEDLNLEEACDVSMETVNEDVEALKQGLMLVEEEQEKEPHNFILFSFLNQTRKKIKDLSDSHLKMKDAYSEVCLMFAESSKTEPAVFFGYFQNFIKSWKSAIADNHNTKRRKMKSGKDLVRRRSQQDAIKDLAEQAALMAAARADNIRKETRKLERTEDLRERRKDTTTTPNLPATRQDLLRGKDKSPEGGREEESYLQANVAPDHFNSHLQKTRLGQRERKETFPAGESKNMPDQPQKGRDQQQQQHQGLASTSSSPAQDFATSPSPCAAHWENTPTYTSPTKAVIPASRAKGKGQKEPLLEDDEYYTQLMDTNF